MTRIKLCLRTMFAWVVVWCLFVSGCTTADDPNYDVVKEAVSSQDKLLARWRAARVAHKALCSSLDLTNDLPALRFECDNGENPEWAIGEVCECMAKTPGAMHYDPRNPFTFRTLFECVELLKTATLDGFHQQAEAEGREASEIECVEQFPYTKPRDEWHPDFYDPDRNARDLVASKTVPDWAIVLGIAVVGGVVVTLSPIPRILIALCTLQQGSGWACPPSADRLPGQTPQPDPGDDR